MQLNAVFAAAMVITIFLPLNIYAKVVQSELIQQLIKEAKRLRFKIDESKIVTYSKDGVGDFAAVPLGTDSSLNVTKEQIENNEVSVALQCMKTKTLSGCYRIRLTDAVEKTKSLKAALADNTGKIIGKSKLALEQDNRVALRARIIIRGPVEVYIDGVYWGTYDWVIITIN